MIVALVVVLALYTLGLAALAAWLVRAMVKQATDAARIATDAATAHAVAISKQTDALGLLRHLNDEMERRVDQRVSLVNRLVAGGTSLGIEAPARNGASAGPIDEAPQAPVRTTAIIDDAQEVLREAERFHRGLTPAFDKRDLFPDPENTL